MLCGSCGNKVSETELYCVFCGADLEVFASSTEKELEALKMLEEQPEKTEGESEKKDDAATFLDEPEEKKKKEEEGEPLFLGEQEFGGGLNLDIEKEKEPSAEESQEEKEKSLSSKDEEQQQRYAQFFEEEDVPTETQNLKAQEDQEKSEEKKVFRIEDDLA